MAQSGSGGIRQPISLTGDQEVKAAFDRLGSAGEKAFESIGRAARKAAGGVDDLGAAAATSARGFATLRSTLTGVSAGFTTVFRAADTLKGALGALAGFEAIRKSIDVFKEGLDSLREVRNTAAGTGVATDTVKAFQVAMAQAGLAGERAGPALVQFMGTVSDAQKDVQRLGNTLFPTIDVLKGTEGSARSAALGIATLRGPLSDTVSAGQGFAKIFRGGAEAPLVNLGNAANEQAKSFAKLGIDVSKYGKTQSEVDRLLGDTAKQFVKLRETTPADVIRSLSLAFGEDDIVKFSKTLEIIAQKGLPELKRQAAELGLGPNAEDNARLQAYDTAVGNLGLRFLALKQQAAIAFAPFIGLEAKGAENFLKGLTVEFGRIGAAANAGFSAVSDAARDAFTKAAAAFEEAGFLARNQEELAKLTQFWVDTGLVISAGWSAMLTGMTDLLSQFLINATALMQSFTTAIESVASSIRTILGDAFDWVSEKIKTLSSALSALFGSVGTASGAPGGNLEGFAGGGYVSGPGNSTSDSIMARLSDGEYVMRARAVDHWGPQFMAAINAMRNPLGFSSGGIVDALSAPLMSQSMPRFATGGPVSVSSAGGSAAVHLHFPGGQSFPLVADKQIVAGLVRESRRAGMLSAGRAPGIG